MNPSTNLIYASGGGVVRVIDGATNSVSYSISIGATSGQVAVNPTTNRIYVTGPNKNVSVISGGSVIATIPTANDPYAIAVNSVTNRVYIGNGSQITVIDGNTNSFVVNILSTLPNGIAVNPTTNDFTW